MAAVGPLQIVLVGFETTEHFRGDIARELADLRGHGMIRVLDARLFHRADDGALTEVDLNPLLADARGEVGNPIAHLLGANGAGNGAHRIDGLAGTAGFAIEDLRRLTDEIGPGDHAAVVLVEHMWAGRLRETVQQVGGRLLGQGFLTPQVAMIVGAEIQARTDAEAAIELAEAARGAAIIDALEAFATLGGIDTAIEERTRAAAKIVHVLVDKGFLHESEAADALDALTTEGLVERAIVDAVLADAEDILGEQEEPPTA